MDRVIKDIAIFGAGGFGLEVAMLIEQINTKRRDWKIAGFFDDGATKGTCVNGYEVLGGVRELNEWSDPLHVAFALGIPKTKKAVLGKVENPNIKYPTLIHPSVMMGNSKYVTIGEGCIICAGTIITTNITIGNHVILNLCCTVGHESVIGDYSAFMPSCNISGEVNIGKANFWGTGAKIINRLTVGDEVTIGAGAVITTDIPAGVTAVGVPAKVIGL